MSDQLELVTAALADKYAVERELGAGGMATVYLARDPKHDRQVAIKVLHPDLAASLGAERFLREIQITAKLTHPHILPLYDSGEAGGFLYYVMPYILGESLSDTLAREKQLAIKDAVQIVREVAEALSHAHSYGLVHRDIKPDNILMSGGHAIVADFGIARAVTEAGAAKLTQTGMSVGTPAYMSPEQAMGAEDVDARSDIYSLGCVLYELLVGQIPFTGPTPQAIMARHSMDVVPPPTIVRGSIPDELEDIIMRAMAKVPADRFRSAHELAEALAAVDTSAAAPRRSSGSRRRPSAAVQRPPRWRRWLGPAGGALVAVAAVLVAWSLVGKRGAGASGEGGLDPRQIAVLYFRDESSTGEYRYVADGLTEGLIDQLSRVPGLTVVSRNGVAPYRGTDLPRDSIARALGTGTLIAGSVEPEGGNRLRVTTRLIEGLSGADFQRASFVLPAGELLTIRDSAAGEIARILRARLGEEIQIRRRRAGTDVVAAWALLQRAEQVRKEAEDRLRDDPRAAFASFARADSLLAEAERADPRWTEPVVLRGQIAYRRARLADDPRALRTEVGAAVAHADRALALSPAEPEALELRGTARYFLWARRVIPDPKAADSVFRAAKSDLEETVRIDPLLASAQSTLSHLYYQIGDRPSAVLAAQRAYERDAYLSVANDILWRLFLGSYDLAQFTQAQRWCQEGGRRFPGYWRFTECRLWLMTTPAVEPDVPTAWSLLPRLDSLTPGPLRAIVHHRARMIVGGVLGRAGLTDSARRVMAAARAGPDVDPTQELLSLEAFLRTLVGDDDVAIDLLKQWVAANHAFKEGGDHWWWRKLRSNPRFHEVEGRH